MGLNRKLFLGLAYLPTLIGLLKRRVWYTVYVNMSLIRRVVGVDNYINDDCSGTTQDGGLL